MSDGVRLTNPVRTYAWGSRTVLPLLLGVGTASPEPWAEIWMGAHPDSPSRLPDGRSLAEVEPGLPYLVKLLAVERPLSIQAHPDAEHARAGFAAEEARGLAHAAPTRSYKDANHKPELLVALTPTEALCGFRPPDETHALAELLSPSLSRVLSPLAGPGPRRDRLAKAFEALAGMSAAAVDTVVGEIAATTEAAAPAARDADAVAWVGRLAGEYPGDFGVLAPLVLRYLRLEPGEGVFVRAGVLHAYLRGAGVEVQASSDNVLRGGLTAKHVDLPELLRVVSFESGPDPRVAGREESPGLWAFEVPVADFAVWRAVPCGANGGTVEVPAAGPRIATCVQGEVEVAGVHLTPGAAAFVQSGPAPLLVRGEGACFVTAPGSRPRQEEGLEQVRP
ncbi:MAG: mannose-6-phosphate isomerase, class I [Kineosporiaceae bacterium]